MECVIYVKNICVICMLWCFVYIYGIYNTCVVCVIEEACVVVCGWYMCKCVKCMLEKCVIYMVIRMFYMYVYISM